MECNQGSAAVFAAASGWARWFWWDGTHVTSWQAAVSHTGRTRKSPVEGPKEVVGALGIYATAACVGVSGAHAQFVLDVLFAISANSLRSTHRASLEKSFHFHRIYEWA